MNLIRPIVLLLCCALRLYAQREVVPHFEHISIDNGLPSNTVNCAIEDKQGFMWFGTRKGLYRYDGYEFRDYNINQIVNGLAQTTDGTIFVSTDGYSLMAINPVSGRVTIIDKGPSGGGHNTFVDFYGHIWYSDRNGVNRYNPVAHKTIHYPLKKTTYIWHKGSFVEDGKHHLWVLGTEVGLFKFDRKANQLHCIVGLDCPRKGLFDAGNMDLYRGIIDSQQILWAGSSKGLLRYDIANDSFKFVYDASLVFAAFESINANNEDIVWFGTDRGIGIFDPKTKQSKKLTGILPFSFSVNQILKTQNDNVWFCTSEGLLLYSPYKQAIQSLKLPQTNANGKYNNIHAILQDKADPRGQTFWLLSAYNGLWKWNRANNALKRFAMPQYDGAFEGLWLDQDDKNRIWIGGNQWAVWSDGYIDQTTDPHREGVFLFDPKKEQFLSIPFKTHPTFFSVPFYSLGKIDRKNRLWLVNYYEGIHAIDLATGQELALWDKVSDDSIMKGGNWVMAIFEDRQGRMWFGTNHGLWYFDETNKKLVSTKQNNPAGLETAILKITEDKAGLLWVTGWDMLAKIDTSGKILKRWSRATGLVDTECRQVAVDAQNNIWVGTYDGLQQFTEANNSFRRLTIENGLLSNNTMTGFWTKKNELIVGGDGGLNTIDIEKIKIVQPHKAPQFSKILVNDKPIGTIQNKGPEISLKREQNGIQFFFTALNFEKKHLNQYSYYLENWDKSWHKTTENSAMYSNLSGGHYVFHVKQNTDNKESVFRFAIAFYWYETAWAKALFGLLIVGLVLYFSVSRAMYRRLFTELKIEQSEMQKKDQELANQRIEYSQKIIQTEITALRAQMNPHFIFNCLNSIQLFTAQNNIDKASNYLSKFSRLIRLVLENSRSEKVTLENELESLRLYIELEAMRFRDKFSYTISVAPSIDQGYVQIPPLLLQPFVENAIWHGLMHKEEGGKVTITVEPQYITTISTNLQDIMAIQVTITDDGVGREKSAEFKSKSVTKTKSFGMKVTAERIELINQLYKTETKVQIIDLKDTNGQASGTTIIIEIPV